MFFGAIAFGASPFSDVGFNPDAKVQVSGQSLTLTLLLNPSSETLLFTA